MTTCLVLLCMTLFICHPPSFVLTVQIIRVGLRRHFGRLARVEGMEDCHVIKAPGLIGKTPPDWLLVAFVSAKSRR